MSQRTRGRVVEVESVEQLERLLDEGATSMRGWHLQDLDLRPYESRLEHLDAHGAVVLGCLLSEAAEVSLRHRGALVFPGIPDVPFDLYRSTLYTADELYDGLDRGYDHTLDARVYAWSRRAPGPLADVAHTLATALHDHAIDDALHEYVQGRQVVGIMGGHGLRRGTEGYADAARLGHDLAAAGLTVATGGGPGAMEAANLGARASVLDEHHLGHGLARLADAPEVGHVTAWARTAMRVVADLREAAGIGAELGDTLGVPTWFYGHEPPNLFATSVAKYFANSVREDVLLQVCTRGTVFLPGAAGTVQEVFQDACENYYAPPGQRAPMVLVGTEHWTERLPTWTLLLRLAEESGFADDVHVTDDLAEAVALIRG